MNGVKIDTFDVKIRKGNVMAFDKFYGDQNNFKPNARLRIKVLEILDVGKE